MSRGDKSSYTAKQKRQAKHIVESEVDRGANSNMRCDSLKSLMIINKLSKF
ncbi:hypothetical protein GO859_17835, partial [Acinetobacter baumannii]|nr:hypothetical protein [Acinetobacter baumannii]